MTLAWVAGFVDASGWIIFDHLYTSHMTGNTSALARVVYLANGNQVDRYGWPVAAFVIGLLYSAFATRVARRRRFDSSFSIALVTEILLLGAVLIMGPLGLISLSLTAAAMGVQTVTVTRINGLRVFSTYLSGSLAKFSESIADFAFWVRDRTRGRFAERFGKVCAVSYRQKTLQHAALTAGMWAGFFWGAYSGVGSELRAGDRALLVPIGILGIIVVIDVIWPVAAAEEAVETQSAH